MKVFKKLCQLCVNSTKTAEKKNIISSNLLRMCNIPWILGDISFLSAISHGWMNKHMKFYQGQDKNIGGHGYLSVHRVVEYFIQLQDLKRMEETWASSSIFSNYRQQYDKLSSEIQVKKDNQRDFFSNS